MRALPSVYTRFVGGVKTNAEYREKQTDHSNDKPFTPADSLTALRPILAVKAASMLITGTRGRWGVTPIVAGMAATDMEGIPARAIDKWKPGSGWGTTAHGAPADTVADTGALIIVSSAALLAPRVSKGAKVAIGSTMGQEGYKAIWALRQNRRYMKEVREYEQTVNNAFPLLEVSEEQHLANLAARNEYAADLPSKLELPASALGKAAMADKFTGLVLGVATHDTDDPVKRQVLTAGALYFSGNGSWNGEMARRAYVPEVETLIEETRANTQTFIEQFGLAG